MGIAEFHESVNESLTALPFRELLGPEIMTPAGCRGNLFAPPDARAIPFF